MAALTETLPVQTGLVLALTSRVPRAEELQERLERLLVDYSEWLDPLSNQLRMWALQILAAEVPKEMTRDEFQHMVAEKLDELETRILMNPLTQDPLQEPLLDRLWVWERWMQEDYQQLNEPSPFDEAPMEFGVSHEFAQAMIVWLGDVREIAQIPPSKKAELLRWQQGEGKLTSYLALASAWIAQQREEEALRLLDEQQCRLIEFQERMQQLIARDRELLQQRQEANRREVKEQIDGVQNQYQEAAARLHTQIQHQDAAVAEARQNLAAAYQQNSEQQKQIAGLLQSNEGLRAEVQRLRDESGGGCVLL